MEHEILCSIPIAIFFIFFIWPKILKSLLRKSSWLHEYGRDNLVKKLPNNLIKSQKFMTSGETFSEKYKAFLRLFGINPDGYIHDSSNAYELTKEEIINILDQNSIPINWNELLQGKFASGYSIYYFRKLMNINGEIKYKLCWQETVR